MTRVIPRPIQRTWLSSLSPPISKPFTLFSLTSEFSLLPRQPPPVAGVWSLHENHTPSKCLYMWVLPAQGPRDLHLSIGTLLCDTECGWCWQQSVTEPSDSKDQKQSYLFVSSGYILRCLKIAKDTYLDHLDLWRGCLVWFALTHDPRRWVVTAFQIIVILKVIIERGKGRKTGRIQRWILSKGRVEGQLGTYLRGHLNNAENGMIWHFCCSRNGWAMSHIFRQAPYSAVEKASSQPHQQKPADRQGFWSVIVSFSFQLSRCAAGD